MSVHAKLSASGSPKWLACQAAPRAEADIGGNDTNIYAAEGTAAHFLASERLTDSLALLFDTSFIYIDANGDATWTGDQGYAYKIPVTDTMQDHITTYIEAIQEFKGVDGELLVEQAVPIGLITGEPEAKGTADAIIFRGDELQIHDLKYGMKEVEAEGNTQLMLYAGAALRNTSKTGLKQVTMVIHQPRLFGAKPYSSWTISVDELKQRVADISGKAGLARHILNTREINPYQHASPGEHCMKNYCKARATCPALISYVEQFGKDAKAFERSLSASDPGKDFLETLGRLGAQVPMIASWCKMILDRVSKEVLENGLTVPGFKAVLGKEGNRAWVDEAALVETLKELLIDPDVYEEKTVLSPTALSEQYKAKKISKGDWPEIEKHITRSPAKPVVVSASDKREAVKIVKADLADGFEDLT